MQTTGCMLQWFVFFVAADQRRICALVTQGTSTVEAAGFSWSLKYCRILPARALMDRRVTPSAK